MELVPILQRDIEELRNLAIRTYDHAFKDKNAAGVLERYYESAFAKAHLSQQLEHPYSHWYFTKVNNQTIGYLKLNTNNAQTEPKGAEALEIERIYIDIPHLSKGYGKKLIEFTISKAREWKKKYIWLGVWKENPRAIAFYKRCGFQIVGTHKYDMIAEIQIDYIMHLYL